MNKKFQKEIDRREYEKSIKKSNRDRILGGAMIGSGLGIMGGNIYDQAKTSADGKPSFKGTVIGALGGAALGGGIGYLLNRSSANKPYKVIYNETTYGEYGPHEVKRVKSFKDEVDARVFYREKAGVGVVYGLFGPKGKRIIGPNGSKVASSYGNHRQFSMINTDRVSRYFSKVGYGAGIGALVGGIGGYAAMGSKSIKAKVKEQYKKQNPRISDEEFDKIYRKARVIVAGSGALLGAGAGAGVGKIVDVISNLMKKKSDKKVVVVNNPPTHKPKVSKDLSELKEMLGN